MLLAREGDLRESLLVRQGRGSFNLSSAGHEAVAAIAPHLIAEDLIFPAYRDRALMHARGMTLEESARDFFAREGSSSGGRNLPGHFSSQRLGVFSITSPVGAQCLPAVGAAWARRLEGSNAIALCHIGDAATRQGEFFEAVAQAVQERLGVVFVVEDNGYGISSSTRGKTPLALGMLPEPLLSRVNGREAAELFVASGNAIERARRRGGPSILWCDLDRLSSHTNADDHRVYRSLAEIDGLPEADPLDRLVRAMLESGNLDESRWEDERRAVADEVREVYARVERESAPSADQVETHLYGARPDAYPELPAISQTTMLRGVNDVLRVGLQTNAKVIVFGEDVEDPKGGVFGLTKGLSSQFPDRVVNSPLAEATIVGTAVGLAALGWRPVFELQFVDFVGPAYNQLVSQLANLRWRTKGDWTCPAVLYAPYGAYLPGGGMWHSQSNEGLFAGIPGLRVAVPSTPSDAVGLFWSAMHDDDPSLIMLPKHLLHAQFDFSGPAQALSWGKGRVVRDGTVATVVAWGNAVEIALAAAERLDAEGLGVEIVDPRSLVPFDWDLICDSLTRTGRLLVVQEDSRTGGFGQAIVAEAYARLGYGGVLKTAPVLVSRPDIPVPFSAVLETAILPSAADVVRGVRALLSQSGVDDEAVAGSPRKDPKGIETLVVPQLGEGLRQVVVTAHLKRLGDEIAMDEPLYEVETDKANVTIESALAGVLTEWCVAVGEHADVHGPIARVAVRTSEASSPTASVVPVETLGYAEFPLSERQRAMNRSALGGRLDVALPASVVRPLRWSFVEEARARLRAQNPKLKLTEFAVFAFAVALATRSHPKFRSTLVHRGETVRRFDHVDLGFAIALPDDELVTAVIRDADALCLGEFVDNVRARHREAKAGSTQSDSRTTLLLSSLADFEIVDAAPVLFPPAIATLFVGTPTAGAQGREATMRLAFDHRLINGVGAADYLRAIESELRRLGTEPSTPPSGEPS